MSKGTLLLLTVLVVLVLLIGRNLVDSCWFQLGDHVVAKRNCSLFREPAGEKACSFEGGEVGIITTDTLGNKTKLSLDTFDCWHFISAGRCQGWVLGSNLAR